MKGPLRVRRPNRKIKGGEGRKSSETKGSSEDVGSHYKCSKEKMLQIRSERMRLGATFTEIIFRDKEGSLVVEIKIMGFLYLE